MHGVAPAVDLVEAAALGDRRLEQQLRREQASSSLVEGTRPVL